MQQNLDTGLISALTIPLVPVLNLLCARLAHIVAYRSGHLNAGVILGALLGPVGILLAILLPRLRYASIRILHQLEDTGVSTFRWGVGVTVLLGGGTLLAFLALSSYLGSPFETLDTGLLLLAVAAAIGGTSLVRSGLPPMQWLPPLGDHADYAADDPELAAEFERFHNMHRRQQLTDRSRLCAVAAFALGLVILLAAWDLQYGSRAGQDNSQWWALGATLLGLTLLSLTLYFRRRYLTLRLALQQEFLAEQMAERLDIDDDENSDVTVDVLMLRDRADYLFNRHLSFRSWSASIPTAAAMLALFAALLLLQGSALDPDFPVYWYFIGVPLALLSWPLRRSTWRAWAQLEDLIDDAYAYARRINRHLAPEHQVTITMPDPPAAVVDYVLILHSVGWTAAIASHRSWAEGFPLLWLWLPLAAVGLVGAYFWRVAVIAEYSLETTLAQLSHLQRIVLEVGLHDATSEPEPPAVPVQAETLRHGGPAAQPLTIAPPATTTDHFRAQRLTDDRTELEIDMALQRLTAAVAPLEARMGFKAALASLCGVGAVAFTGMMLANLHEGPAADQLLMAALSALVLLIGAALAATLMLTQGGLEEQLARYVRFHLSEQEEVRTYLSTYLHVARLQRQVRAWNRVCGSALWLLAVVLIVLVYGIPYQAGASPSPPQLLLLLLAILAAILAGLVGLRIYLLCRALAQSRDSIRALTESRMRAGFDELLAQSSKRGRDALEVVELPEVPPAEWVEAQVRRAARHALGEDPTIGGVDALRSVCYFGATLLFMVYLTRSVGVDPEQDAALMPLAFWAMLLALVGVILGAVLRFQSAAQQSQQRGA